MRPSSTPAVNEPKAHARPATVQDALDLAPKLRPEDLSEIYAMSGHDGRTALLNGVLEGTECWTVVSAQGDPIAMFGINHMPQLGPDQAAVWMLASPELVTIKAELFAQTETFLGMFHHRYPLLWNYVDARNEVHLKWLKRSGFTFLRLHETFGFEQRPFYEFVRLPPCANR